MRAGISRFSGKVCPLAHTLHRSPMRVGHARFRSKDQRRELDQVPSDAQAHVSRFVV